jgi:hypothetical protein
MAMATKTPPQPQRFQNSLIRTLSVLAYILSKQKNLSESEKPLQINDLQGF